MKLCIHSALSLVLFFLIGCGGSSDHVETWSGSLRYVKSECDIIKSDPPALDPTVVRTYEVELGDSKGDSVYLVDDAGNGYEGSMLSDNSFFCSRDSDASQQAPSAIEFSEISAGKANVTTSFLYNAPHGCAHYFSGVFRRQ